MLREVTQGEHVPQLVHASLKQYKKLSYRKQIARKQRTHSNSSKLSGRVFHGEAAYGTPVAVAAAVSTNFSVG